MTPLSFGLRAETLQDIGWTLAHFAWQGLLLASLLRLVLAVSPSSVARHNWSVVTLVLMTLAPVVTFFEIQRQPIVAAVSGGAIMMSGIGHRRTPLAQSWPELLADLWFVGILVLSVRALGGWYFADRLRRHGTRQLASDLLTRFRDLQRRVAVTRPVRYLESALVCGPVVVGWLRPVILIPAAALAGLSARQLEAVIAHELAHIKRLDGLVSLLQMLAETLLFYHPAIWWVSRRISEERENCCDDVAVTIGDNRIEYVRALAALEGWRHPSAPVLAASGGTLKRRATRLLGLPAKARNVPFSALIAAALLCAAGSLVVPKAISVAATTAPGAGSPSDARANMTDQQHFLQKQIDAYEVELRKAELKREEFRARYSDLLPTGDSGASRLEEMRVEVVRATDNVGEAEARRGSLEKQLSALATTDPAYRDVKLRLVDQTASVAALRHHLVSAESERDSLEKEAQQSPQVARDYINLNRDYEIIKRNYELLLQRREQLHTSDQPH